MHRSPLLVLCLAIPCTLYAQNKMPSPDAALPPADASNIKAIVDKDIADALASGNLAPGTNAGVAIGVISHGRRVIWSYGTAHDDSVFEIGSITKTFTSTILAQMVLQKQVSFSTPVRDLLPPGTVAKPEGREITLLDLADQHSGLPRMPANFHPNDHDNPYSNYTNADLFTFIGKHGVALKDDTPFLYSNLGVGLLGTALALHADLPYPELLQREVVRPLSLQNTATILTPAMKAHMIQGYHKDHTPAHPWDFLALAGCGAIRSDVSDMLTYLQAQLHPEDLPASTLPEAKTLSAAIAQTHIPRAQTENGRSIALNWFFNPGNGAYWHNGGTGGYNSYATFQPEQDFALIVLYNVSGEGFADKLGTHIFQRMMGKPAISLSPE